MSTDNDPWGRVADDGTVYVRTADGERVVGSMAGGQPRRGAPSTGASTTRWPPRSRCWNSGSPPPTSLPARPGRPSPGFRGHHRREPRPSATWTALKQRRLDALSERADSRQAEHKAARERAKVEAIEGSRSGSSPRRRRSRRRPRTGSPAASASRSCWRSGRTPRTATARPRPRSGSGCRPPGARSPSAARATSPPWRRNARGLGPRAQAGAGRPGRRNCPARPTGPRPPPLTAT